MMQEGICTRYMCIALGAFPRTALGGGWAFMSTGAPVLDCPPQHRQSPALGGARYLVCCLRRQLDVFTSNSPVPTLFFSFYELCPSAVD